MQLPILLSFTFLFPIATYCITALIVKMCLCKKTRFKPKYLQALAMTVLFGALISLGLNASTYLKIYRYKSQDTPLQEDVKLQSIVGVHTTTKNLVGNHCNEICQNLLHLAKVDRVLVIDEPEQLSNFVETKVPSYTIENHKNCDKDYLSTDQRFSDYLAPHTFMNILTTANVL